MNGLLKGWHFGRNILQTKSLSLYCLMCLTPMRCSIVPELISPYRRSLYMQIKYVVHLIFKVPRNCLRARRFGTFGEHAGGERRLSGVAGDSRAW